MPDNPSEYVTKLETELRAERIARQRAEQSSAEYQAEVHSLNERVGKMTSAATSAAATAIKAIERIQVLDDLATELVRWYRDDYLDYNREVSDYLVALARAEFERREARS